MQREWKQMVESQIETYHALHDLVYVCFGEYPRYPREIRDGIREYVTPLLMDEFTILDPTEDRYITRRSHHYSPDNVKHDVNDIFRDGYGLFCYMRSIYLYLGVKDEKKLAPMMRSLHKQFARIDAMRHAVSIFAQPRESFLEWVKDGFEVTDEGEEVEKAKKK